MARRCIGLLTLVLLALLAPGCGAESFGIGTAPQADLTGIVSWCKSPADLPLAAVLRGECPFSPATRHDMNQGFSRPAIWLRLELRNDTGTETRRWLVVGHARLERVDFFVSTPEEKWDHAVSGTAIPPEQRALHTTEPVMPVIFAPGEVRTVLIRIASRSSITATPSLWRPEAYVSLHRRLDFAEAIAFGALLMAAVMPLMIFLQGRDRTYLYFSASMATKAVFNSANAGLLSTWLLPEGMAVDLCTSTLFLALTMEFYLLFVMGFSDSQRELPRCHRTLIGLGILLPLSAGWAFLVDYRTGSEVEVMTSGTILGVCIFIFWCSWRRGLAGAGFLLVPYLAYLAISVHRIVLALLGIPHSDWLAIFYSWGFLFALPIMLIGLVKHHDRMRRRLSALQAESTARLDFLARMSHELRTPLDIILGNVQLLSRPGGRLPLAEGLGHIRTSGEHLLRMIDDILDHVRGLAGRLTLVAQPVDLSSFLQDVASGGEVLAARQSNRFFLARQGPPSPPLRLDPHRLRQVLDNLLANAARHTRNGRIGIECALHPEGKDIRLDFAVSDSGEGILPADLERIFRPFERGGRNPARDGKGIGMGLAISHQIVELMGGHLQVESRPGEGARFFFSLRTRAASALPEPATTPPPAPLPRPHRATVLLIEDDDNVRRILAHLLDTGEIEILEASNGNSGLALAAITQRIDLVLTDQFMDDGDGWQVLRRMRATRPDIPVVLISAAPPAPPAGHPAGMNFDAALLKPLNHEAVRRCIGDLLGLDLQTQELPAPPGESALEDLRRLIEGGQISDIIDWSETLRRHTPSCAAFADRVATAAHTLDFPRLEKLAGIAQKQG